MPLFRAPKPLLLTVLLLALLRPANSLQRPPPPQQQRQSHQRAAAAVSPDESRRSFVILPAATAAALLASAAAASAAGPNGLPLTTAPSGLRWADAKVGSGRPVRAGDAASIDYSMASTAGRFPQIYTTKDTGAPYRWTLGDGSTIAGIERAVVGDSADGVPPMLPGGVRRVIIPAPMGYQALMAPNAKCVEGGVDGAVGPIPPKDGSGAYQRWYQFYCNPRIPYQPDLVLDIKLYGKRTIE